MKSRFSMTLVVTSFLAIACGGGGGGGGSSVSEQKQDLSLLKLNPRCTETQMNQIANLTSLVETELNRLGYTSDRAEEIPKEVENSLEDRFRSECEALVAPYVNTLCDHVEATTITTFSFKLKPKCHIEGTVKDIVTEIAQAKAEIETRKKLQKDDALTIQETDIKVTATIDLTPMTTPTPVMTPVTPAPVVTVSQEPVKPILAANVSVMNFRNHSLKDLIGSWREYPVGMSQNFLDYEVDAQKVIDLSLQSFEKESFKTPIILGAGDEISWDLMMISEKYIYSKDLNKEKNIIHAANNKGVYTLAKFLQSKSKSNTMRCSLYLSKDKKGLARGCTYKLKSSPSWGMSITYFKRVKKA